jgi:hypothetical protein
VSITLAALEQETARRVGPYWRFFSDRQEPSTAGFDYVNFPELRTNADLDLVTNLWMLRRGECYGEDEIVAMDPSDRQRVAATYAAEMGRVFPDRQWGTIPDSGEYFEFHNLNPEQELRVAVLAGLRRCFLPDTVQVQPAVPYGPIDLTAQFAWLTEPWQAQRVRYGWLGPYADVPFDTYTAAGHLFLTGTYGLALPTWMWLDAWRPSWSWVNGAESTTGPTNDFDVLEVDLDYAASAGHIEAWHHFPARMQMAAAGGTQATQAMAAAEFGRQVAMFGPRRPVEVGFQNLVRIGVHGGRGGWLNGPW